MIITNYAEHQTPQLRVLTDGQCHDLYLAALECLNRIGVLVPNAQARNLLLQAGSLAEGNRVFVPPHIVQDALAAMPSTFTIWGRDQNQGIRIAPDRVNFGPGPTCTYFIDPQSGERRKALRGDAALTARVCDSLPNIDYVMGLSLYDDVTANLAPVYEFADMLANTTKPVLAWANSPATLDDIYRIALTVAGGESGFRRKPNFAFFASYDSPLKHRDETLACLLMAAERGVPMIYLGGPTVGLESPFSAASALTIHLASVLSALAIVQLHRRGAPFVGGGIPAAMDLRTARPAYGSPELTLHVAAAVDLARYLHLPFMGTGGASESKLVDAQAGVEAAFQILFSALSGSSLVHDIGFLDCADIGSLDYLVLVDEIIGMAARLMRGIRVNPDTIMLDLIEQVGPGGHFLMEERSARQSRFETWVPSVLDRTPFTIWEQKGRRRTEALVHAKLLKILEIHRPVTMPETAQKAIEDILAEAERREANQPAG